MQTLHQRSVLCLRVCDDNIIVRHEERIADLTLCTEGLTRARGAENQTVGVLQFLPVNHDQVIGQGVQTVVQAFLAVVEQLLCGKRHKNRRAAGGQTTLDLDLAVSQRQAAHQPLLLLKIKAAQFAVVLLRNADCLKHVGFQFLLSLAGVQHQKSDKEHPLVLRLQFFQQGFCIPPISCQIRRQNVHIVSSTDGFFLLLDLAAVQFRDGVLDGFNCLVLVNGLDMHGNDLAGIHVQKILQQLVAQVRSRDIQKADRSEDAAHLKGAAVLKRQRSGRNGVLYRQPAGHKVFPVEMKLVGSIHVQHPMHQPQTLRTVQRFRQNAKPVEVVHQVVLDVLQPRFNLCHAVALNAVGQKLRFRQAVVALGKLLPQHLTVLGANIVKTILLVRDADGLFKVCGIGGGIHKGQLKVDRAVEKVEKTAPFLKDGGLVLLLRQLVIDILILDGTGVVAGTNTAGAVLKHPLERDALLRRAGHRGLGRLFAVFILFQKRNHGSCLPSSKSHSSCWSCTGAPSGEQSAPESSTAGSFQPADRSSGTSPERTWAA